MSKITNDGLIRSSTEWLIALPIWQQWASKEFNLFEGCVVSMPRYMKCLPGSTYTHSDWPRYMRGRAYTHLSRCCRPMIVARRPRSLHPSLWRHRVMRDIWLWPTSCDRPSHGRDATYATDSNETTRSVNDDQVSLSLSLDLPISRRLHYRNE